MKRRPTPLLLAAVGCLSAALVYVNSLDGQFVHDDIPAVAKNPDVTGKNAWHRILTDDFWGLPMDHDLSHKSYRPITTFIFRFNYQLCDGSSACFHLTNFALHIVVTLLLSILCIHLESFNSLAPLLFALHPLHTEAVSGIVGCADVLASVFFLASFLSCLKDIQSHGCHSKWLWLSIGCGALALFSKEIGIMAILINICFKCILLGIKRKPTAAISANLVDVTAILLLLLVRLVVPTFRSSTVPSFSSQDNEAAFHPDIFVRTLTFLYLPVHSFWLLLCPSSLSYDWQMGSVPLVKSCLELRAIAAAMFYALLFLLYHRASAYYEKGCDINQLRVGLLFLVLPYLPASNLLFNVGFVIAERVLYTPSIGFCLLVDLGIKRLCSIWSCEKRKKMAKRITRTGVVLLLLSFTSKTLLRNREWANREELFRSALKYHPTNAKVHYNYANVMKDRGFLDLAEKHYREAIRLWPSYTLALNNLATVVKDFEEAEAHLKRALTLDPGHANSLFNFAVLLRNRNNCESAIPLLERCIFEDPENEHAHVILRECLLQRQPRVLGEQQKANKSDIQLYSSLMDASSPWITPSGGDKLAAALCHLAETYMSVGEWSKAEQLLLRPRVAADPLGLYQLSQVFLQQGRAKKALETVRGAQERAHCQESRLRGACEETCVRLIIQEGDVLQELGKFKAAASCYASALRCSPSDGRLLLSLGTMYHALGDMRSARDIYERCMLLEPENSVLKSNLDKLDEGNISTSSLS